MTRVELEGILRSSNKFTEDEINKKLDRFDKSVEKRSMMPSRSAKYSEISNLLGVDNLSDVRFYKILNISAVVIRDYASNITKVAFSIYRDSDIASDLDKLDSHNLGVRLLDSNSNPLLHPITISKEYDSCLWSARNFNKKSFYVELDGIRVSELAVYEAWINLSKNKVIPRQYRKINLDVHVVSVTALNSLNEGRTCPRRI